MAIMTGRPEGQSAVRDCDFDANKVPYKHVVIALAVRCNSSRFVCSPLDLQVPVRVHDACFTSGAHLHHSTPLYFEQWLDDRIECSQQNAPHHLSALHAAECRPVVC